MTDVLTRAQRSLCMSRIRGSNTKPEIVVRRTLFRLGLRYRLHTRLPGRPDLVFVRERVAIFVDGCFWHRCPKHATAPATNVAFWTSKLQGNVVRDAAVNRALRHDDWLVLRFWEHAVRQYPERTADRIRAAVLRRRQARTGAAKERRTACTVGSPAGSAVRPVSSTR